MNRFLLLRKWSLWMLLGLCSVACTPIRYYVNVERKAASQTQYDLSRASVSLMALHDPMARDSAQVMAVALGFAQELEAIQHVPEGSLPVYTFVSDTLNPGDVGYLPYLLPEEVSDYLVVFDSMQLGDYQLAEETSEQWTYDGLLLTREIRLPFSCRFLLFHQPTRRCLIHQPVADSLVWTVLTDASVSDARLIARAHESLDPALQQVGKELTTYVSATTAPQEQLFLVFENDPDWFQALEHVADGQWEDAIAIWTDKARRAHHWKVKAAAACNLSVACRMMGNPVLAAQWLDWAAEMGSLPEMPILRAQLKAATTR